MNHYHSSLNNTVVDLFNERVRQNPSNIAIEHYTASNAYLTYQELNNAANRLANHLLESGIGSETFVGIYLERSIDMIIAVWGVLKAGGAFVPLDPQYPVDRLKYMVSDSEMSLILTQSDLSKSWPFKNIDFFCMDQLEVLNEPISSLGESIKKSDPENLAYVIYTSGTTGKPKGTLIEHRGLTNLSLSQIDFFKMDEKSRVLQRAPFSFDASISEIMTTLVCGATLCIIDKETLLNGKLHEFLLAQNISHVTLSPSYLALLPEVPIESLKTLVVAGESCPESLLRHWAKNRRFINAYGPTEVTVCASMAVCSFDMEKLTIGKPMRNTRVYLLNDENQLVPKGEPGELCVAGVGLARGYLNRPELTAKKFIELDIDGHSERIYRTGDLARWLPDGNLEFLGRIDEQIKLRGFRIEPGEIESLLRQHPTVHEALVQANRQNSHLDAYLTPKKFVELWPSIAEFYVYDEVVYRSMATHLSRNDKYLAAFKKVLPGTTAVEIGPGPELILSRLAIEAGAKKVYAIELLENTYLKAKRTLISQGLGDQIVLIHGDATKIDLPEKVDYCISEIVGSIGGSEGAAIIINNARRFLKNESNMIPQRSVTKIAAVTLKEGQFEYGFSEIASHYVDKIFNQIGYPFDLRLCVKNFPNNQFISDSDVFEELDYTQAITLETSHKISLKFNKASSFTGLLVWLTLSTDEEHIVDSLEDQHSWLPIYLPIFTEGHNVKLGDKLTAVIHRSLCDNRFNPDYRIVGQLHRAGQPTLKFNYYSYHFKQEYRHNEFYKKLFNADGIPSASELNTTSLKNYLAEQLPNYMVPSTFTILDQFPLSPNGKINRKALPIPDSTPHFEEKPPENATQQYLCQVWSQLLKTSVNSIRCHFFDAGGHSLLAVQLISQIRENHGIEMPISVVFENPLLEQQGHWIDTNKRLTKENGKTLDFQLDSIQKRTKEVLSFAQQGIWFLTQMEGQSATYNIPLVLQLQGDLDVNALRKTLLTIVQRHQTLRSCFPSFEGKVTVQINDTYSPLDTTDLSDLPSEKQQQRLSEMMISHAQLHFDLSKGPLLKLHLLKLGQQEHILLFNMHHIVGDGWSKSILIQEWSELYNCYVQGESHTLPTLPIQYADYAAWQRNWLKGEILEKQLNYWEEKLADIPDLLELPTDYARPAVTSHQGKRIRSSLSPKLSSQIQYLSRQHGVTDYIFLLTVFKVLLHRYSGQTDIAVGSPIANRTHQKTETLIGFFVNTLVLRDQISPTQTFLDFLAQVRQTALESYNYQDVPFEILVEKLNPTRSLSHSPLFQVMFALQNTPDKTLDLNGISSTFIEPETTTAKFDLALVITQQSSTSNCTKNKNTFICDWEFRTDLFRSETIRKMVEHLEMLLDGIVQNPDQKISQLPLLTPSEKKQLISWNQTERKTIDENVVSMFEAQAHRCPGKDAVVFSDNTNSANSKEVITYGELNIRSNRIAHLLIQSGIKQGSLVGICMERSPDYTVGVLAILKAGAAYVPLDTNYPTKRIQLMIEDSGISTLLIQDHLRERLEPVGISSQVTIISVDLLEKHAVELPENNPGLNYELNQLAYVIYTSGSTGTPKGVMISHASLANLVSWHNETFSITAEDRSTLVASIAFDASVWELWPYLCAGSTLYPVSSHLLKSSPSTFKTWLENQGISILFLPTPLLESFLVEPWETKSISRVLTGGDLLHSHKPPNVPFRLFNNYGPTENTVVTTSTEVFPENSANTAEFPPIGRPILNTQVYILDANNEPTPPGIPGELCISGVGLALGYLNRPKLTAEKFVELELFGRKQRIYKTGDTARWLTDNSSQIANKMGSLEYLGRIDHQVKIRGFRIETGEIEAALCNHHSVNEAIVVLHQQEHQKCLIAYVTIREDLDDVAGLLKRWLKSRLPEYMVPAAVIQLEKLPLTPNGKIDRKQLPVSELFASGNNYEAPQTETEKKLVDVWSHILKQTDIGIRDNFFDRGGDSILSIQIVAHARSVGLELNPRDVFQHQTIAELALVTNATTVPKAEQGRIEGGVPLTPIQRRFFNSNLEEPWYFNQSVLLSLPDDFDEDALLKAVEKITDHHDGFRLRYRLEENEWKQWYDTSTGTETLFQFEDLCSDDQSDQVTSLQNRLDFWQASLNLETGPICRFVLFKIPDGYRLFWCVHHLIVDGVSWRILLDDLQNAYQQAKANQQITLQKKSSSFKDWADYLHSWKHTDSFSKEIEYWERLSRSEPSPLPVDYPEGRNLYSKSCHHTIEFSQKSTKSLLTAIPSAYRTQINDILVSALMLTLYDWTKSGQHWIDLESHGRADLSQSMDLSRTVGWFTSVFTVALDLPNAIGKESKLGEVIKSVKKQLREVPNDGVGYGVSRYLNEDNQPQAQILFNYLGQFDQSYQDSDFSMATEDCGREYSLQGEREHPIEINGQTLDGVLSLTWTYSVEQYDEATIKSLAENYKDHLENLIDHCLNNHGYSPSNFPLVSLNQKQLDQLDQKYPNNITDIYPLSPMQKGMLFHNLYNPEKGEYFEQLHFRICGPLEIKSLQQAWQFSIDRHTVFRTVFWHDFGDPFQIILKHAKIPWEILDWRDFDETECHEKLQHLLTQERQQGFDLNNAPLMRVQVIQETDSSARLVWHYHHLLMDGWSLPIVLSELFKTYAALVENKSPNLSPVHAYKNYISWLLQQNHEDAQAYWRKHLKGFPAPTPLPVTQRSPGRIEYKDISFTLDSSIGQSLKEFSRKHRLTLNTLIQGAWAALLSRCSGESDVVFGVTTSGRETPIPGIEEIPGLFINTLPLRVCVNDDKLLHNLHAIQETQQQNNQYAHSSLADIQAWSDVPTGTPLFDSIVVFENYPVDQSFLEKQDRGSLQISEFNGIERTNYPLTLAVIPEPEIYFCLTYDCERFSEGSISRMIDHLRLLLAGMVNNPDQSWLRLPIISDTEQKLIKSWNQISLPTHLSSPKAIHKNNSLIDLFEAQVKITPDNIALVWPEENGIIHQLSYKELNNRANQLAHHLVELDIELEELVGIYVDRSFEMIVGILGILKAGGAYLPIDPESPKERLKHIVEDSEISLLLTQKKLRESILSSATNVPLIISLDDDIDSIWKKPQRNPLSRNKPESLAYVIYTSGSTGKPKGCKVTHSNVTHLFSSTKPLYKFSEKDVWTLFHSYAFDFSVWELWGALLYGGKLVVVPHLTTRNPDAFFKLLVEQKVTILNQTPSAFQQLIRVPQKHQNLSLRYVIFGGEALDMATLQPWFKKYGDQNPQLVNMYGITETTVHVTHCPLNQNQPLSKSLIGRPIPGLQVWIVDKYDQPVPIGVPGEMVVSGAGVSSGYLNRPDLTNERFRTISVYGEELLVYKSGDIACWNSEGNLEYLGRHDHQVKLRGFRIELGEIEAALTKHKWVRESLVELDEQSNNPRLIAYLVLKDEIKDLPATLRQFLQNILPDYMIPAGYVVLDQFPLTSNGKIDRKNLPAANIVQHASEAGIHNPQSDLELKIAEVWKEILRIKAVGLHDNFFERGGHSILLLEMRGLLQDRLKLSLNIVDLFQYPTIHKLAQHLTNDASSSDLDYDKQEFSNVHNNKTTKDIAVIGMAGVFPGAKNIDEFWNNLRDGVESIRTFTDEELLEAGVDRKLFENPNYVKAGGYLDHADWFDASFFGYSPKDAEILDPQKRLFLETAWTALEHAGYDILNNDVPIGVFAGASANTYFINNLLNQPKLTNDFGEYQLRLAGDKDFVATLTAYKLNLKGPALNLHTACSTSLVAIHVAVQNLLNGECEMALAGGVSSTFPQKVGYLFQDGMILSPDGHCRVFDADARGTLSGAGVGIVVLKRLEDALEDRDTIHAVIKGSAINNDGMDKVGFTAPSVEGQSAVISKAMHSLDYESIGYVETHGTATELGDPIEVRALTQSYQKNTNKNNYCALGSVKSNFGHLDAAAGVTGFIKTVLALKHGKIPPSLHFKKPNPKIDFENSPFYVNNELTDWSSNKPRLAGVSSFGLGGTNAHVVLEESPTQVSSESRPWQLICVSARTKPALKQSVSNLAEHLSTKQEETLADVAYTLGTGRSGLAQRGFLVAQNLSEAAVILSQPTPDTWYQGQTEDKPTQVAFMFPGYGSQYINMARDYYEYEPTFRKTVEECVVLLKPLLGMDIRELMYPEKRETEYLEAIHLAQPALFVTEYALAKLFSSWGIKPVAMIGHSAGECVAACLAGVLSLEDALKLVIARGQLMEKLPAGAMVNINLAREDIEPMLDADLCIALHNSPSNSVVSGTTDAIDKLVQQLEQLEIEHRRLQTSHAYHSPDVDLILPKFRERLEGLVFHPPQQPYISNLTGTWITDDQATSLDYWCQQLRQTVLYSDGIETLKKEGITLFLELGPGRALSSFVRQHSSDRASTALNTIRSASSDQEDHSFLLNTLGQLWLKNVSFNWKEFYSHEKRLRIPLPTYPFERKRCWIEPSKRQSPTPAANGKLPLDDWFLQPQWKRTASPALQPDSKLLELNNCLVFSDRKGVGPELSKELKKRGYATIQIVPAQKFEKLGNHKFSINPSIPSHYWKLFSVLKEKNLLPDTVYHLWSFDESLDFDKSQTEGFYCLLYLAQFWPKLTNGRNLYVATNQVYEVTGAEDLEAIGATLSGPVQTIGAEFPDISCRCIDCIRPSSTSESTQLVEHLLDESHYSSNEKFVAYRFGRRWIREFENIRLPKSNSTQSTLRSHGVYLITGGFGGIGFSLAKHLAQTVQAKLILISRSISPNDTDSNKGTSTKSRQIVELQEAGAEVLALQADVSDQDQMREALAIAKTKFGDINGVIHAAGIPGDGVIQLKSQEQASRVLAPKVKGSLLLEELIDLKILDFVVFCSALNAVSSTPGQIDYCSANSFQDTYACVLKARGINSISINWDGWKEVGLATKVSLPEPMKTAYLEGLRKNGITPEEGIEVFDRILNSSIPQVLVSTTDWALRSQFQYGWEAESTNVESVEEEKIDNREHLSTNYTAPRNHIEKRLVQIWTTLIGVEKIGIYDNFFELGGHSLLMTRISTQILEVFSVNLPMRDLFESPTISKLAGQIDAIQGISQQHKTTNEEDNQGIEEILI